MDDLTDEELPGYALLHCTTEVAAFHKKHLVRLLRLAGDEVRAVDLEASWKEWWHLGPEVIEPIVKKIFARRAEG